MKMFRYKLNFKIPKAVFVAQLLSHRLAKAIHTPLFETALSAVHRRTFLCLANVLIVLVAAPQLSTWINELITEFIKITARKESC